MKKAIKIIGALLVALCIIGIFVPETETENTEKKATETVDKNDSEGRAKNKKNKEKKETADKKDEQLNLNAYEESVVYSMVGNGWKYAEEKNIGLPNFMDRKTVLETVKKEDLKSILEQSICVEEKTDGIFNPVTRYKKTLEQSEYYYYGSLNSENMPEGFGILFVEEPYYSDYLVKYIGTFKDGTFNGYGVCSDIVEIQGQNFSERLPVNEEPIISVSGDCFEGYFEEGKKCGWGIEFSKALESMEYNITVGEYADDTWNGEIKVYWLENLLYEGETKDGNYEGQGVEYYRNTDKIKYKGEFQGGTYWGKGTLYDENGNIVHKGEFVDGDVK